MTGINGLLGTNVANALLTKGYYVKAIIRNKARYQGNITSHLEMISGGLFGDWQSHLNDIDIFSDIAADTSQNKFDYSDYWQVNVNATIQLFEAAVFHKVKKFIYISTASTMGTTTDTSVYSENIVMQYPLSRSHYVKSKAEAEHYILSRNQHIDVVVLNPGFIPGPFDSKPSSGAIILMAYGKQIIWSPSGGKNFVHVADVAHAVLQSIDLGKNGERILLVMKTYSLVNFFKS
jgi:dihydroflavonol-4-reductase